MKKIAWLLLCLCAVGLSACAVKETESLASSDSAVAPVVSTADASPASKESLKEKIEKSANAKVVHMVAEDFDSDGKLESFALTGDEKEQNVLTGWFANASGAEKLTEDGMVSAALRENCTGNAIDIYELGKGKKCIIFESGGTTTSTSYVFTVENSSAVQQPISVMLLKQEENGSFTATCSAYDSSYLAENGKKTFMGHTWKPYWFYWDGSKFCEYVGTEISMEELMKYDGAEKITAEALAELTKNTPKSQDMDLTWKIIKIYRRDNGVININYGNDYATGGGRRFDNLKINDNKVDLTALPDTGNEGYYLPSMLIGETDK